MGQHFEASIHFGILLDEDWIEEKYGKENDPAEALETAIDTLAKDANLGLVVVGYFDGDETTAHLLAHDTPTITTIGSDNYYAAEFEPAMLQIPTPGDAIGIAQQLGLDWADARWHLCWTVS